MLKMPNKSRLGRRESKISCTSLETCQTQLSLRMREDQPGKSMAEEIQIKIYCPIMLCRIGDRTTQKRYNPTSML